MNQITTPPLLFSVITSRLSSLMTICAHPKCNNEVGDDVSYKNGTCSSICSKRLSDLLYRRKIRDSGNRNRPLGAPHFRYCGDGSLAVVKPVALKPQPMMTDIISFRPSVSPLMCPTPDVREPFSSPLSDFDENYCTYPQVPVYSPQCYGTFPIPQLMPFVHRAPHSLRIEQLLN
ncbi:hypothetical protein RCL1_005121 [Eukaryota sp. TZLM3-RCL]